MVFSETKAAVVVVVAVASSLSKLLLIIYLSICCSFARSFVHSIGVIFCLKLNGDKVKYVGL